MARLSDISNGERVFLSYLNDDNQTISGYAELVEISDSLVKFKTNQNLIIIPTSRLLKIKKAV